MTAHTTSLKLASRGIALVAACAAALVVAAPGHAGARLVNPVEATCWRVVNTTSGPQGRIIVTSPEMDTGGGAFLGPNNELILNPMQRAQFRVHLTRWNGRQWTTVASGPWKQQDITATSTPDNWLNLSTNQLVNGTHVFWITPGSGSYAIYAEYYWVGNQYFGAASTAGYTWLHFDHRLSYSGAQAYCTY